MKKVSFTQTSRRNWAMIRFCGHVCCHVKPLYELDIGKACYSQSLFREKNDNHFMVAFATRVFLTRSVIYSVYHVPERNHVNSKKQKCFTYSRNEKRNQRMSFAASGSIFRNFMVLILFRFCSRSAFVTYC